MNPWEEDLVVAEAGSQVKPWEEDITAKTPRGANLGGALRNIAQATPFVGTYADEAEALLRSSNLLPDALSMATGVPSSIVSSLLPEPKEKLDYETLRRNAEESALGNIENTSYGRALNIGTNMAENALAAYLTGGATLLPTVSAAQGGIEGFGRGSDLGERATQAGVGAGFGFVVPQVLNRLLPTKTTQTALVNELAKSKDATKSIFAKALQQGSTPEEVIAQEVPKGMRPDLWANMRRGFTGRDTFRKPILEEASSVVSTPYSEYIEKEIANVSPKYASKIGKEIEKLKLDDLGEDIVGEFDPRQYVMNAVNKVMKSAPAEEQDLVAQTMENAIAKRGVAKKLTSVAIERPIGSGSGSIWNILRRINSPIQNLWDSLTLRGMTAGTVNAEPKNALERMLNFYTPNAVRGTTDALIEDYERRTLK